MNTTLSRATRDPAVSVSVIVTTYNHAAYLDDAIRSVIGQSVPASEIIVVDDGSTDHPEDTVSGYPQIRLIRQENQGLSAARNTGLRAAISDKIIFLDADDRLCRGAIEAGLECFHHYPKAGFVYGAFHFVDTGGSVTSRAFCRDIGTDSHLAFLRGNQVGMHGTVLYDRRRLLDAGGFDVTLRRCEDYDIYLRISKNHPVANHRQTVAEYRRHGANMSSNSLEMLCWAQRVLDRYKPPEKSGPAAVAWRQGHVSWRRQYVQEILFGREADQGRLSLLHRIADSVRVSPVLTALHLIRRAVRRLKRSVSSGLTLMLKRRPKCDR